MPELPEVETVRRGLDPPLTGRTIIKVDQRRKDLRVPFPTQFPKKIEGRKIIKIGRRAKYLLFYLDDGQVMVLHLGMSGRVQTGKTPYKPQKHDHLILSFSDGQIMVFNDARRFGLVILIDKDDLSSHKAFRDIGPEPLEKGFDGRVLNERLKGKKVAIKIALMDQRVVAGVGNIYASEALFLAGISPLRAAGKLKPLEAERLVKDIKQVLEAAIRSGGSSLRDHLQIDGKPGYFQHHFAVYDRAGEACPGCTCDARKTQGIKKIVQGGRATFYCPRKQT